MPGREARLYDTCRASSSARQSPARAGTGADRTLTATAIGTRTPRGYARGVGAQVTSRGSVERFQGRRHRREQPGDEPRGIARDGIGDVDADEQRADAHRLTGT